MYYKSWFDKDIKLIIDDITNNDAYIYKYDEYNVTINFLQYSGMVRSISPGSDSAISHTTS